MSTKQEVKALWVAYIEATQEAERLSKACGVCSNAEQDQALTAWEAAYIKAAQASRLYHASLEAQP